MAYPPTPPVVIVVGDVMVDVVVRPVGPFNRGSDTRSQVAVTPGGSASNQAVALAVSGAEAHLVALVGEDEMGDAAARALTASGVRAHLRRVRGAHTGVVVALVDPSGERSMLTDRGANLALRDDDVPASLLARARHLHLSGYDLLDEATRPAALAVLEAARAAGLTRSVDPCSAGPLAAVGAEAFLGWVGGLDLCCANRQEGEALTGSRQPAEVLGGLRRYFTEVVLTLGADGALYSGPGADMLHCPAEPVPVTDTTGAGDAFTGTFLARRLNGDSPIEALQAGLRAAARVVGAPGARTWQGAR